MRFLVPLLAVLAGCNSYTMFNLSGYEQESFSNKADLLFIIDNSESMQDEAEALATNFSGFISQIAEIDEAKATDNLSDAVGNYVDYVQNPGSFVDFQLGITTTNVEVDRGLMLGKPQVISRDEKNVDMKFIETLLCEATCFDAASVPSGGGGNCNNPPGDEVTSGYLDCLCGAGEWENNCGSSREEPLEATFLALCRSVENPPVACFEDIVLSYDESYESLLVQSDAGTNDAFLRDRATLIPVIVSDEGDDSRRMEQGDAEAEVYDRLTKSFGRYVSWVVIGPPVDSRFRPVCPSPSPEWGTVRYQYLVQTTNGRNIPIEESNACGTPTDFGENLQLLGELLQSLITAFPLRSVPIADTLMVYVDDQRVEPSPPAQVDEFGLEIFADGWSFDQDSNSIKFHGAAIPPNDAKVEVFYEPLDGMPRDLPL